MGYIGNSYNQQVITPATDFFSGNGVTTTFTLTRPVQSVYGIEVVVNNVQQNPSSTYSINASNQLVLVAAMLENKAAAELSLSVIKYKE